MPRRIPRPLAALRIAMVTVALLLLVVLAIDVLADAPLRRRIEREMNRRLTGYSVALEAVDFSPWTFSLDLFALSVVQDAHPEPPVARFPRVAFSVHWRSLLAGRLVSDALLESPRLHVHLAQLREERTDEVEIDERGWQDALLAAYPLKINELEVRDGALVYTHERDTSPLELSDVELLARNIRNIDSPERTYPSEVRGTARVFDHGRAAVAGYADFLAEPHAGIHVEAEIEDVPLDRFDPLSRDVRVVIEGGELSARGEIEYSARHRSVHLEDLVLAGVRVDYHFDPQVAERTVEAAKRAEEEAEEADLVYRLDRLRIIDGDLGFVDRRREPGYRAFLSGADLRLTDLASRAEEPAEVRLEGRFMGSGETVAYGVFRPDGGGADFDVGVAIRGTEMTAMNDLLESYAGVDVRDGTFSFYAEIEVVDGTLEGYIKPLFEDVDVYDSGQDRHKGLFRRIRERIVEGLGELLANRPRDEVATIADLQGSVDDPGATNWQVLVNLVRNAFFEAILPGFERERDGRRS